MGKLAYIYDHRFYKFGDDYYSEGAFNEWSWERYLSAFDSIMVFSSIYVADDEKVKKLNRVTNAKVQFTHIEYISSPIQYLRSIFFINPLFLQELKSYDAVAIRMPGLISNNAFKAAKMLKKKIAIEVVGCIWDSYSNYGTLLAKILAPIEYFRMKYFISKAHAAIYVTKYFLQKRYPSKGLIGVASNVNIECKNDSVSSERIKRLNISNDLVFGLSGSFNVRYKGHYELLKALSLIKNDIPQFRIELIGPGDFSWVEKLAIDFGLTNNLNIKGKLKAGDEVMNWLDGLNIYIHPSKQEGLPRSVIEAMSRGCIVLASSIAGTPELLGSEFLHKPGDFQTLANQIKNILKLNKSELMNISNNNVSKANEYDSSFLNERRKEFWNRFKNL